MHPRTGGDGLLGMQIEEPSTPLAAEGTGSSARKNPSSRPLQRTVNATVCGAERLQEFLARTGFSEDLTPFYLGRPLQAVCSSKDQEGRGTVWSSQVTNLLKTSLLAYLQHFFLPFCV